MEKKHFILNLAIQIDAEDESEALKVLSSEETLKRVLEAISQNEGQLHEIQDDTPSQIIN